MSRQNKKGRPTLGTQSQIKSTLLQYYEANLSAPYAAKKTGYDIKTVYRYYNEFYEEIAKFETSSYFERQKQDRIQIIVSFDSQIDEAGMFLSQINSEIENSVKEKKSIPRHLFGFKLDAMRFRSSLTEKKAAFVTQQQIDDDSLKKKIEKNIEEYNPTGKNGST